MSQSRSTQITPSLHPSSISLEDVRNWTKVLETGHWRELMQEHVDANVEWTHIAPADGPLGKTTPLTGVYNSREEIMEEGLGPIMSRFVDSRIDFEIVDVFIQPSQMNDVSECHLTKAIFELKGSGVLKNSGQRWNNYYAGVWHFDNTTKRAVKVRMYQDSAAANKAFED
ncbi:hypothetical protein FRB96_006706 [Tulasnella sp. 330]|nr:hypothetical protein FRB96_006706 [Tulasnella sp. 330]KAG8870024.1 hypothetical protein FRB97_000426 [Tulasnella sp. 331]KAG8871833.1 hypothetical protein FRB98_000467 [Tulasnella sp. 332]